MTNFGISFKFSLFFGEKGGKNGGQNWQNRAHLPINDDKNIIFGANVTYEVGKMHR